MNINRTLRLSADQYMQDVVPKTQIYLHHTVGGSAKSSYLFWQSTADRVGTAFIVERDGTIYEVFSPHFWCYHLGLKTSSNTTANKQSIGIELASEGALRSGAELNTMLESAGLPDKFDNNWLYAFDIDPNKNVPASQWFKNAKKLYQYVVDVDKYVEFPAPVGPFRGFTYFDAYDDAQIAATNQLVRHLCDEFNIPKKLIGGTDLFRFDPALVTNFSGVLTHANVRSDKSDLNPSWDWTLTEAALYG